MKPTRSLVGFAGKLAARMERAKEHFERGFGGKARMRVHRDAAAIVAHRNRVIAMKLNLDPVRVASDGLVHRIIQDFGDKVMQRTFIGAADVHAGPFADRFEPLKDLDRCRVVISRALAGLAVVRKEIIRHGCSPFVCWA